MAVARGEMVAAAYNAPISRNDPTAHAEILALRQSAERLGNYRLEGVTLYCTLEPCADVRRARWFTARIDRLVFGTRDLRFGAVRSKFQLADSELLNHRVEIVEGILAPECVELLREFFEGKRRSC
ncbi:MAG: nucleoside deaminase [Ignavibacteriota bacterium]